MTAHTPGPWRWNDEGELIGSDGSPIVITDNGFYPPRRHDRPLIAAAPELLAALKELLGEAEDGIATCPLTRKQARAAIAKAEGRE